MKPPSKQPPAWNELRAKVLGLGERSMRKSYYPELQARLADLERFRALLDKARDGILLAGMPDGLLLDANETALQALKIDKQALSGKYLSEALGDEPATLLMAQNGDESSRGSAPLPIIRSNDRDFEVTVSRERIGEEDFAVVLLHDITERLKAEADRKRLEGQLHRAQRLESLGKLAGGVAHDFNNLLTGIGGNAELLLMELDEDDPHRERLTEIIQGVQSAAGLTHQLLAFSRKQMVEPRVMNLNQVIEYTEKMLRRLIGEDIELSTHLTENLNAIRIDPNQVEQILVNLAVNARDAMPNGGKLTLETMNLFLEDSRWIGRGEGPQGDVVMLAVSDNGIGMDETIRNKVFEPFFTTKETGRGTGLGLAMVYGSVRQHGGGIEVYSEPGRGSTFKIYFPAVFEKSDSYPQPRPSTEALPHGTETVLVVEDNAAVRRLAVNLLQKLGYRVLEAPDGPTALVMMAEKPERLDLLLTDVVMPDMNGKELALRLGETRPVMKVLYSSGYTEQVIAHHGVLEQGIHFIAKPYATGALARKVRTVLDFPSN